MNNAEIMMALNKQTALLHSIDNRLAESNALKAKESEKSKTEEIYSVVRVISDRKSVFSVDVLSSFRNEEDAKKAINRIVNTVACKEIYGTIVKYQQDSSNAVIFKNGILYDFSIKKSCINKEASAIKNAQMFK